VIEGAELKKIFSILIVSLSVISSSSLSHALGGLEFLSKAPISFFTPEDSRLFKSTVFDVLDNHPDGETVKWLNTKTNHSGKVKATKTFVRGEFNCRTIKIFNRAGGTTGQGAFDFCKSEGGPWKIH